MEKELRVEALYSMRNVGEGEVEIQTLLLVCFYICHCKLLQQTFIYSLTHLLMHSIKKTLRKVIYNVRESII